MSTYTITDKHILTSRQMHRQTGRDRQKDRETDCESDKERVVLMSTWATCLGLCFSQRDKLPDISLALCLFSDL